MVMFWCLIIVIWLLVLLARTNWKTSSETSKASPQGKLRWYMLIWGCGNAERTVCCSYSIGKGIEIQHYPKCFWLCKKQLFRLNLRILLSFMKVIHQIFLSEFCHLSISVQFFILILLGNIVHFLYLSVDRFVRPKKTNQKKGRPDQSHPFIPGYRASAQAEWLAALVGDLPSRWMFSINSKVIIIT